MGDFSKRYNMKSPAVKRLMREAAELREPTDQYFAQPLDDNLFEWHFTVRGPPDTEFDDGRYHGRITLPPEYPMKPPSIILLTPNGRFELGKKICLSMSAHHPETWQPSWSIRTVLLALIGFMPTPGGGAIGALDHSPEERKVMARRSKSWKCEGCGNDNADCLLERDPSKEAEEAEEVKELAAQINFKGEDKNKSPSSPNPSTPSFPATAAATPPQMNQQQQQFLQQQMQQFYNNTNNPLLNNQQQPFSSQMPSSVTTTTTDQQQPAATTPTTTTESNETTLRQRTTRSQQPRNDEDNNNRYFENTTNRTSEQSSNVETSRAETISFYLVWIILIPLIILILRRLGMEGGGMSKHEG